MASTTTWTHGKKYETIERRVLVEICLFLLKVPTKVPVFLRGRWGMLASQELLQLISVYSPQERIDLTKSPSLFVLSFQGCSHVEYGIWNCRTSRVIPIFLTEEAFALLCSKKYLLSRPSAHRDGASRMLIFSQSDFVKSVLKSLSQITCRWVIGRVILPCPGESSNVMPFHIALSNSVNFDTGLQARTSERAPGMLQGLF